MSLKRNSAVMAVSLQTDLWRALFPTLKALNEMKESLLFQEAIETINQKLLKHEYLDAWKFIDAIMSVFDTAHYSKKSEEFQNCQTVRHSHK